MLERIGELSYNKWEYIKVPYSKRDNNIKEMPCTHPEHNNPPMHIVLEPGIHRYICPGCGKSIEFVVPFVTC